MSVSRCMDTDEPIQPDLGHQCAGCYTEGQQTPCVVSAASAPVIRRAQLAHVRQQIEAGTYYTEKKLEAAARRLLDSLGRSTAQETEDENG